jgi:sec-independent protein translocase protein TatA
VDGLFGVGAPELVVIFVVALLVFGPKRLPELGRTVGSLTRRIRNASYEFQQEFHRELNRVEEQPEEPQDYRISLPPTKPEE